MSDDLVMAALVRFIEHRDHGPQHGASYNSRRKWGYLPDTDNVCPHCEPIIKRTANAYSKSGRGFSNKNTQRDLLAAWNHCCTVRHIACVMGLTKEQTLELRRVIRAVDLIGGKR